MAEEAGTVAALKRWLAKVPRGTAALVVVVPNEAGVLTPLLHFSAEEDAITPALAEGIAQSVSDHVEAIGQGVLAVLQYVRADGSVITTKRHKCPYQSGGQEIGGDELLAKVPVMNGDTQSQLQQAQLHLERGNRALMMFIGSVLAEQRKMSALVMDTLERVTAMHASTLDAVEQERAARHSAEDAVREAGNAEADNKTLERVGELVAKVLPAMLQKPATPPAP